MNKQKGLAPILIVLLIALGVGGYLLYQKQLKPASRFSSSPAAFNYTKIYTNSRDDFSFSYPQNWTIENSRSDDDGETVSFSSPYIKANDDIARMHIFLSKSGYSNNAPDFKFNSTVGNIRSYRTADPNGKMQTPYVIEQFKKGNIYYQINFFYNNPSAVQVFDQILSTFKFLP